MIDPTLTEMLFFGIKAVFAIVSTIILLVGILIIADTIFSKDEHDEHENTDERIG
jgi:uncharacterized membrane protein